MEKRRQDLLKNSALYSDFVLQPSSDGYRFGEIPGVKVGMIWDNREDLCNDRVHTRMRAGISGSPTHGAYSIVVSGAYEDDKDEGETFVYTGTGGRPESASFGGVAAQIEDQTFNHPDNMALKKSFDYQRPVRVIRGHKGDPKWAPLSGFRYDGLYIVDNCYVDKGVSGYKVCKYHLRRVPGQVPLPIKIDR